MVPGLVIGTVEKQSVFCGVCDVVIYQLEKPTHVFLLQLEKVHMRLWYKLKGKELPLDMLIRNSYLRKYN